MSVARAERRVILNFHGIGDPPRAAPLDEHRFWCPRSEWPGIADAMADAARDGARLEVTFDDGNVSDVEDALPALVERELRATFHVCAGRIGTPGYLDARALRVLRDAGMGVGSHGWNHVDLRTLPEADLVHETRDSRQHIAEAGGVPVTAFAVPFGSYDRRVLGHLGGYTTVYTSDTTSAARQAWLVPRWSNVQGWTAGSVKDLTLVGESPRDRLRQRASMLAKRWR